MKTVEEAARDIKNEAFDEWRFDPETKQYKGSFSLDKCAAVIRNDRMEMLNMFIENLSNQ